MSCSSSTFFSFPICILSDIVTLVRSCREFRAVRSQLDATPFPTCPPSPALSDRLNEDRLDRLAAALSQIRISTLSSMEYLRRETNLRRSSRILNDNLSSTPPTPAPLDTEAVRAVDTLRGFARQSPHSIPSYPIGLSTDRSNSVRAHEGELQSFLSTSPTTISSSPGSARPPSSPTLSEYLSDPPETEAFYLPVPHQTSPPPPRLSMPVHPYVGSWPQYERIPPFAQYNQPQDFVSVLPRSSVQHQRRPSSPAPRRLTPPPTATRRSLDSSLLFSTPAPHSHFHPLTSNIGPPRQIVFQPTASPFPPHYSITRASHTESQFLPRTPSWDTTWSAQLPPQSTRWWEY